MINKRVAETDEVNTKTVAKTLFYALLSGIGIGIGFVLVRKLGGKW